MHRLPGPVRYQDLQTFLRACQIIIWLGNRGLELAKEVAQAAWVAERNRREYLLQILPISVVYAIPGNTDTFMVECSDGRCFRLQNSTLPLLWQIMNLERNQSVRVVKIIHDDGHRQWAYYCL